VARGEFSVGIAGIVVRAGIPAVGPIGTGYVLVLAMAGPVLTRFVAAQHPVPREPSSR
jgi:CPA2 family monovalent cation:H+ antiporter-2